MAVSNLLRLAKREQNREWNWSVTSGSMQNKTCLLVEIISSSSLKIFKIKTIITWMKTTTLLNCFPLLGFYWSKFCYKIFVPWNLLNKPWKIALYLLIKTNSVLRSEYFCKLCSWKRIWVFLKQKCFHYGFNIEILNQNSPKPFWSDFV